MLRRDFLAGIAAFAATPNSLSRGEKIAQAAAKQIGVTRTYDPNYTHISYPNGDVPRERGVCADVIVRACRDALSLDLQKLVHEDMLAHFDAYPAKQKFHQQHPDSSIDHRRVVNLEVYWQRTGAQLWVPKHKANGNDFPLPLKIGDFLTWRLNGHLPHIGVVASVGILRTTVIHNWGNGTEESWLHTFAPHPANGHFRWPV